jgi:DHA1 family bicyclomycin/chloramphenicol resistance-like MFS transporter
VTPRSIVIFCGFLMSISAFSVDITLPSFSAMVHDLRAPYASVQWTITIYMFTAGLAQLAWGPASDRYGRRPIMATGLSIFLFGCLVSALSPTIEWLLAGRALQGLGAAAAIVLARAILRDLFSGEGLARNLALSTAIFAAGPILAPLAGAAIAALFGWRAIFAVLAVFGAGLLFTLLRMQETLPASSPDSLRPAVMGARLVRLFGHGQSRYFLLLSALVMSSMLLNLAALPRIYDRAFGVTGTAFAVFFALHGTGIVIGQVANRRLIRVLGTVRSMLVANGILIVSAGLMLGFTLGGWINAYLMTALLILFATSYLVVFSNAAALVLDPHGDIAGFAASVFGVTSQIGSAVTVSALVVVTGDSVTAYSAALLGICLGCFAAIALWQSRHGPRGFGH